MDIKTKLYVTKIFDNNLVAFRENEVTLALDKPACWNVYFGIEQIINVQIAL